jgi:hypothetical protein
MFISFYDGPGNEWISVCKARRARLPPSHLWIFPPRSQQHSHRSWYFEWPGYNAADHPLYVALLVSRSIIDE